MIVTLLRHAPTEGNLLRRYIGRTDEPLCEQGRALAQNLHMPGSPQTVYTSALKRAVETAKLLYPAARIVPMAAFNEMDFGAFENKSYRELSGDPAYRLWLDTLCEGPCPGGEDKAGFVTRCSAAFLPLARCEAESGAQGVYLVVHGGTIMALMSALALPERAYFDWQPGFCGGYMLEYHPDTPRPLKLLETIPGGTLEP